MAKKGSGTSKITTRTSKPAKVAKQPSRKSSSTMKQTTQKSQKASLRPTKITPMQMELLDLFANKELSRQEVDEIKDMLSDYFLEKAQEELEQLAEEKEWDL